MIQAAMLFALGAFASGLFCLAFFTVLARRIRRVTEQRLKASLAITRADFDTERDEMRARNATVIRRLERDASTFRDRVTAYRLDSDLKTQEIAALRSDLASRDEEIGELGTRLEQTNAELIETKKRLAETGTALRAGRNALEAEMERRLALQDEIQDLKSLAEDRRVDLIGMRAEIDYLRSVMGNAASEADPEAGSRDPSPEKAEASEDSKKANRKDAKGAQRRSEARRAPGHRSQAARHLSRNHNARDTAKDAEPIGAEEIARISEDIRRMSADRPMQPAGANGSANKNGTQTDGNAEAKNGHASAGEEVSSDASNGPSQDKPRGAEDRFFQALADIRQLKQHSTKTPAE
ncbi:hypothetical protein [Afifella marina]|uniref:Uncharacterized protein n=1 Tax=Afifella marina DSM 2698 TaxID=1120955 RepID=A0A1G5P5H1_AFIMA|nr:hypothetical protein [Afifella marina]SCZ44787.1 hypothetical protein SAMN03080610_03286 [Afifella marina DSM 2698]